ncbi:MAG: hypothetical protein IT178_05485 [Acidobacteria bacterium]|nr:hypothetical protein [Acidobacteriota bacterium]
MRRAWSFALLALLITAPAVQAQPAVDDTTLRRLLREALTPALPFPEANDEGTPRSGPAEDAVWTVRWPEDGTRVEVVANPLHPGNHEKALKAEEEIQRAVMESQRTSLGDYERAAGDFARTGRIGADVREVSLSDEGIAGERYDAESQVTIEAERRRGPYTAEVGTAVLPVVQDTPGLRAPLVRVSAHEYGSPQRYAAEQAWVFVGVAQAPTAQRLSGDRASVAVTLPEAQQWVLISVRGNAPLVRRIVADAQWSVFVTLIDH